MIFYCNTRQNYSQRL